MSRALTVLITGRHRRPRTDLPLPRPHRVSIIPDRGAETVISTDQVGAVDTGGDPDGERPLPRVPRAGERLTRRSVG